MNLSLPTPEDFGADPTGATDSTAALQSWINSLSDGSNGYVQFGSRYKTGTLSLFGRSGVSILGLGRPDARPQRQRGSEFIWNGSAGGDAVFSLNGSRFCTLRNISISCDVPNPPACAVRMDKWMDPQLGLPNSICTRNSVVDCVLTPPGASGSWVGVDIARVSPSNCEFMEVAGCVFSPVKSATNWGCAVLVGASSNAKSQIFRRLSITGATSGIWLRNGSALIDSCTGDSNATDVKIDGFSDPVAIRSCNWEHSGMAVLTPFPGGCQNAPLMIEGNRWTISGPVAFNLACRVQAVRDNKIENNNSTPALPFAQNQGAYAVQCSGNVWAGKWQSTLWQGSNVTQGQSPCVDWNRGY